MAGAQAQDTLWPSDPDHKGALRGIRVVDLSRVLAGPLCTQMQADHGASVIKVEPPFGDETRKLGPPFDQHGNAAYFSALNRGKRAISLDLSLAEDREVLYGLLEDADVLVENFLPGTMEKWGLGYESSLKSRYPRLIYCSISGFGDTGPLGGMPGYDAVLQAMCGLMSINGTPDAGPTRIGIPVVDHLTAYVAFSGISMALLARERDGITQRVEATLFDTALSLLVPHAVNWMQSGNTPQLLGSAHPNIAPYDRFKTRDGLVFLGILNEPQFRKFCRCIGKPELAEHPDFVSNAQRLKHRDRLRAQLESVLADWEKAPLCDMLMKQGIPAGPVNTVPEALAQAHTQHRNMVVERPDYKGLGLPIRLSATPGNPGDRPPAFDEHHSIKNLSAASLPCSSDP
jgi:crotonobetainyl-CoA:carnitine CoA-transferase CaiB-like acyl-CoA transferase